MTRIGNIYFAISARIEVYLHRMIQTTEEDNAEAIRDRIVEKHDLGSNSADFVLIQYLKNGGVYS